MKSTVSIKGQVTIPIEVRRHLGLRPGTLVTFDLRPEGAFLRRGKSGEHPVDRVFGSLRLSTSVDAALDAVRGPRARPAAKKTRPR
jgi:AbrB family looped-hinge helix DNA binding protein